MSQIRNFSDVERVHLSAELPGEHAQTVGMMMAGIKGISNFNLRAVIPTEDKDFPQFFTLMDDEKGQVVPAVQRSHIRQFSEYAKLKPSRAQGLFISGVWLKSRPRSSDTPEAKNEWSTFRKTTIGDNAEMAIAIKALQLSTLYRHLTAGNIKLNEVGPKTLGFVRALDLAVQQSLFLHYDK